jgi:hypothetical protein
MRRRVSDSSRLHVLTMKRLSLEKKRKAPLDPSLSCSFLVCGRARGGYERGGVGWFRCVER